jgi:hypothetical protein
MLARSLACAYVRYETVHGMPPFASFQDPGTPSPEGRAAGFETYGEELSQYCHDMRELFLGHIDRYKVDNQDAINVDPGFGAQLAASKQLAPDFPIAGMPPESSVTVVPLDPASFPPEDAEGPKGGSPFQLYTTPTRRRGRGGGLLLAAAAALLLARR